jgi:hypothetical protein
MGFEFGYPNVSLADWQSFKAWQESCKTFPSHLIDGVIDRSRLNLPDNVLPLARGGAIASTALLRKAGYRSGTRQLLPWRRVGRSDFEISLMPSSCRGLSVTKIGDLWMVGRSSGTVYIDDLVYLFGSTPIFTRTCASAKHLAWYCAWHCTPNQLPSGLGWIRSVPKNYQQAVEFAKQRAKHESGCSTQARIPHGLLH